MKFHYSIIILLILSLISIQNVFAKHTFINHMISTPNNTTSFQTAVSIPTTATSTSSYVSSSSTLSPTDVKVFYYASPSYNTSYGEPGKFTIPSQRMNSL